MASRGKEKKTAKGFKRETIKRIVRELQEKTDFYLNELKNGNEIKIVISEGNRKIGKCMNVSMAPIITCGNCKECMYFCYDVKACCQYKNVRKARAKIPHSSCMIGICFLSCCGKRCHASVKISFYGSMFPARL